METSLKMRQTLRMTRPEAAKLQSMTRLLSMGTMQKLAMQRWHQMLERPMTSFKPSVRWTSRGRHTRRPERSSEKFRSSEASFVESSPWSRGRQPLPKRKSAVDAQLAIASVIGLATLSVPSQGKSGPKRSKGRGKNNYKKKPPGKAYFAAATPLYFTLDDVGDGVTDAAYMNYVSKDPESQSQMDQDEGYTGLDHRRKTRSAAPASLSL